MPGPEPFLAFVRKFEELGFTYMVTGSVAAAYYGEPRLTYDVDLILALRREDVPRLEAAFPLQEFYCPPREVLLAELARSRRGHFNLIHHATGFKADVYLLGDDPLHLWALPRLRRTALEGIPIALAPPEYVILKKLEFYREGGSAKHLRDIRRMLVALGDAWDRAELERKVLEQGLAQEWSAAQPGRPEA
jgi:hypothetical protein